MRCRHVCVHLWSMGCDVPCAPRCARGGRARGDRMESTTAVLLDYCVDALIAGVNWRRLMPSSLPAYDEICALMHVVEAELARTQPPTNTPAPNF